MTFLHIRHHSRAGLFVSWLPSSRRTQYGAFHILEKLALVCMEVSYCSRLPAAHCKVETDCRIRLVNREIRKTYPIQAMVLPYTSHSIRSMVCTKRKAYRVHQHIFFRSQCKYLTPVQGCRRVFQVQERNCRKVVLILDLAYKRVLFAVIHTPPGLWFEARIPWELPTYLELMKKVCNLLEIWKKTRRKTFPSQVPYFQRNRRCCHNTGRKECKDTLELRHISCYWRCKSDFYRSHATVNRKSLEVCTTCPILFQGLYCTAARSYSKENILRMVYFPLPHSVLPH